MNREGARVVLGMVNRQDRVQRLGRLLPAVVRCLVRAIGRDVENAVMDGK